MHSSWLATVIATGTIQRGLNTDQPAHLKRWVCLVKVFVEETGEQREEGGMLLYIWQTNYIVINIASLFCRRKKSLLYFKIFSMVYSEI